MRSKLFYLFLPLLFALSSAGVYSQAVATAAVAVETDPAKLRMASFEKVWSTVNSRHYDPTFGGVNWAKVRDDYRPLAEKAASDDELHGVLRKMLGELGLSHFSVFPKMPPPQPGDGARGVTGIELVMVDGKPVVFRVEAGLSAAESNVRPGYVLNKIDGKSATEIIKPMNESLAGRPLTDASKNLYRERALAAALNGRTGTMVKVELLDRRDRKVTVELERREAEREFSQAMGNFPPQEVIFESRRLDGNVGYMRFNMWVIPQMMKLRAAMREFGDASGVIVDLRGNPGGVGGMATGLAGLMMKEQASLGSMRSREGVTDFIVYPQQTPFAGPVVILTDHGTGSTSEVFAAGLQDLGRATVVGTPSAGAVLPSVFDTLPTGAIFQYAVSDYRSPKSVLIEGRGVFPDRQVRQTRQALLNGGDEQLEAAVKIILEKGKGN